jgi:predicted nucleotide-binding protein
MKPLVHRPMELKLEFKNLRFPASVVHRVISVMDQLPNAKAPGKFSTLSIRAGEEDWRFDDPQEFFAAYEDAIGASLFYNVPLKTQYWECRLILHVGYGSSVTVSSETRSEVQTVMNVFRNSLDQAKIILKKDREEGQVEGESEQVEEKKFNIFIGHGHSPDWQKLRDHLRDKHEYDIVTFEAGARAGHHIRDILEEMLDASSLAFLVLTGEDETIDGKVRARQNVIHEAGLFQGRLGFPKAIVILEKGVEEFSNNAGIQHLSFTKGHIEEVFGDVVATIKRELKRKGLGKS